MALVLADRVKDTTTTTGQGTVTLSGTAPTGYQNFSVIGNGNTTYYTIAGGSEWEVGIGTYTSSGTTLSRDTVLSSSAGGTTKVTFSAGTKDVFVTLPSQKVPTQTYTKTDFTATAGQTTFTVAYTVGYVDVYQNGSKLSLTEYTATNGTSVVLGTGAVLNDIIEIIAWTITSIPSPSNLTVGSTSVSSGTNGYFLYNNAGSLGNAATTGSGSVVLATSPTLTTPVLGVATGTSLTLGTASTTQGSLVLANTSANSTTIKSSNSASAAYTITLPTTAGTVGQTLTTDGAGVTSWATPVSVSARNASDQTITASTFTKLTLGTEDWDTNSWFTGGVFTPQQAGYYLLTANVNVTSSQMSRFSTWFYFNTTYILALDIFPATGGSGAATASAMVYFNGTTDKVEIQVYLTGTGTLTAKGATGSPSWFFAEWKHA